MTAITGTSIVRNARVGALPAHLEALAPFLLAGALSNQHEDLKVPGTCLLLYSNVHGNNGRNIAVLPDGFTLPVRWQPVPAGAEGGHDPGLPPSVIAVANRVVALLQADGPDAISDESRYQLCRLPAHLGLDLSRADDIFSGDSCALPLAIGLTCAHFGVAWPAHVLLTGTITASAGFDLVDVGGKVHVLDTCGLAGARLLATPGTALPEGRAEVATFGMTEDPKATLRAKLREVLAFAFVPPAADAGWHDWCHYLNGPYGLVLEESRRWEHFEAHAAAGIATADVFADVGTGGTARPLPEPALAMSYNAGNPGLERRLLALYRPREVCWLADEAGDRPMQVPSTQERFAGPQRWVVRTSRSPGDVLASFAARGWRAEDVEVCPNWPAASATLAGWLRDREGAMAELLAGSSLMAAFLGAAARAAGAQVWCMETIPFDSARKKLIFRPAQAWRVG